MRLVDAPVLRYGSEELPNGKPRPVADLDRAVVTAAVMAGDAIGLPEVEWKRKAVVRSLLVDLMPGQVLRMRSSAGGRLANGVTRMAATIDPDARFAVTAERCPATGRAVCRVARVG